MKGIIDNRNGKYLAKHKIIRMCCMCYGYVVYILFLFLKRNNCLKQNLLHYILGFAIYMDGLGITIIFQRSVGTILVQCFYNLPEIYKF